MHGNFMRVPYQGATAPLAAATEVLYDSTDVSVTGIKNPIHLSQIAWVVFHIKAATNADNVLRVEYSNDQGVTFTVLEDTTVTTAAVENEVYVGHFEHIRVSYINGTLNQAANISINLNLHCGDRSPIGL